MNLSLQIPSQNQSFSLTQLLATLPVQDVDFIGLRKVSETTHFRAARNGKSDKNSVHFDQGVMLELAIAGQLVYSGTADMSPNGILQVFREAKDLIAAGAGKQVFDFNTQLRPVSKGEFTSPREISLSQKSLRDWTDFLCRATTKLKISDKIIATHADAFFIETEIEYVTSLGTHTHQNFLMINSHFSATAQADGESQTRSLVGPRGLNRQSGLEIFNEFGTDEQLNQTADEALALLSAPNCPTEVRDLVILPHQMSLQIHESIGHPLELDRILGDERNFAGWSFVKASDLGQLRYGSNLMNVSFDPGFKTEFASYAFDDGGLKAEKQYLIRNGILERGLGGAESQARLKKLGVANFRASSWNRAPIDRMANINVEPGSSSLSEMIKATENGIIMESNLSWSIDDFRRKFQFGCEVGYVIKDGEKKHLVKNPNYRGSTLEFWSKLKAVGNKNEVGISGSPYCGKGEPSQLIRVGHSSPPCLFSEIDIFGGAQ